MKALRRVWNRIVGSFTGRNRDAELSAEFESHIVMLSEKNLRRGMSPDEARRAAILTFGGVEPTKESYRDQRGLPAFDSLQQDVRYALRQMRRSPGFTATAVLTLALGIGANTAIFSLNDAVMLRMLPVQKPEELLQLTMRSPNADHPEAGFTNPLWEEIRAKQDVFSGIFGWADTQFDLAQGGEAHYVSGLFASGDYFRALGVYTAAGRLFTSTDDKRGCVGSAVLSYRFWQERYGGSPNAIGQLITLNNHSFQITGVTASGFFGVDVGQHFDVTLPLCAEALLRGKNSVLDRRTAWWIAIMGRLKPGLTPEQVSMRLQMLSPQILAAALPQTWTPAMQRDFLSVKVLARPAATGTMLSSVRRRYENPLRVLVVVVGLVLLISCLNIASLMLARSMVRSKEIAVRSVLGASRWRLIRQLLTECILLSCLGALVGMLFARWGTVFLVRLISTSQRQVSLDLSLDARVMAFTALIAILTGLLFGLLPAVRSTKVSLASAMKGIQSSQPGSLMFKAGRWIVASQVALSLVLVVGAGLFVRNFYSLLTTDAGFDRNNVLLVEMDLRNAQIGANQQLKYCDQILSRLQAIPGVISVSQSILTPVSGAQWATHIEVEGFADSTVNDSQAYMNYVTPGYLATLHSNLRAGRNFSEYDTSAAPRVAIINETMAQKFFRATSPIGKYFRMPGDTPNEPVTLSPPIQIVGVMRNAKYKSMQEDFPAEVIFPIDQMPTGGLPAFERPSFEIRTAMNSPLIEPAVQEAATAMNRSISLQFTTLDQQIEDSLIKERLLATLSGFFGGLALLLATIGLYGVLAYVVTQRQKEIGIRMAIGAEANSILWLVLKEVAIMLLTGIPAGLIIVFSCSRFVQKMLFDLPARDGATVSFSAGVLICVAIVAGYFPARRAARADPMRVLRQG